MSSSTSSPGVGGQMVTQVNMVALGVVQIMIGLVVFLFGIPFALEGWSILVTHSGTFVWGALLYMVTGSLTLAAGKFSNICMMKAARSLSISSAVTSLITAVLQSVDASVAPSTEFLGVLSVFHFLQCAVSITVTVFSFLIIGDCKCDKQAPTITFANGNASVAAQAPPTQAELP
ncbi:membrane-spanning 4-domains subfamily A member 12-like [Cheilinus undulatus]|uniref:membrane-spanning 4-domains subfamily A member 12-like n=1 Tax=Cheilinus undulatus TaxID=241271 RepID=UPI001BD5F4AB|nr:membrane-spanning 4-domains subfamily A member 12-like [Cheilinus undulatus]XP_041650028.1 membrane-spanning 4-domains subfamily A member 12-like [Cheilinus undulatus]